MRQIKRVNIFDMDGTLVDSSHRYKLQDNGKIDLQHWRDNEPKCVDDKLLPLAEYYKKALQCDNTYNIIATARVINAPDKWYIENILGEPDYLISRQGQNDNRGGAELKIAGLTKFFNLKNFVNAEFVFYEDNASYLKKVCDKFKIRGVYIPSNQGH